MHIITEPYGWC